tara:strand:- start:293 stop:967 length:675 start_codon:yes stop_codon:yes gene_type:complete
MEIAELHQECKNILSSDSLNPVQKLKGIDAIVKENLPAPRNNHNIDSSPSEYSADDKADPTNPKIQTYGVTVSDKLKEEYWAKRLEDENVMLTDLADKIREMVRESAWSGSDPISLKEALDSADVFDNETWELLESWIDHDRDYNWNYLNLVQFNLKYNIKSDESGFWLSPQHFRMAAIIDTIGREIDGDSPVGFDLDLAKSLYKNPNQIPQAIRSSLATLRHV